MRNRTPGWTLLRDHITQTPPCYINRVGGVCVARIVVARTYIKHVILVWAALKPPGAMGIQPLEYLRLNTAGYPQNRRKTGCFKAFYGHLRTQARRVPESMIEEIPASVLACCTYLQLYSTCKSDSVYNSFLHSYFHDIVARSIRSFAIIPPAENS